MSADCCMNIAFNIVSTHHRTNPLVIDKKGVSSAERKIEYAAGTTWVFEDFSTVDGELVTTSKGNQSNGCTLDDKDGLDKDDLDDFMEDMEGVVDMK